jgi:hypothetical protein
MADIEKSKKFFSELAKLVSDIVLISSDGKIDYRDIPVLLDALKELAKISSTDLVAIKTELADLTEMERDQIKVVIAESFDIENEDFETLIERLIGAIIDFTDSLSVILERALALKDYLMKK